MIALDLRRITCARDLQENANRASMVAKEALEPRLSDTGLIGEIYKYFLEFVKKVCKPSHSEKRKEFMFIVAYLYCPVVLIGGTMPKGFRGKLKDILNVGSPSAISNYTSDLMFLYNHYQDFREIVEGAYSYISEHMNFDLLFRISEESLKSESR